jgi:hypothetical protein
MDRPYSISDFALPSRWERESVSAPVKNGAILAGVGRGQ